MQLLQPYQELSQEKLLNPIGAGLVYLHDYLAVKDLDEMPVTSRLRFIFLHPECYDLAPVAKGCFPEHFLRHAAERKPPESLEQIPPREKF